MHSVRQLVSSNSKTYTQLSLRLFHTVQNPFVGGGVYYIVESFFAYMVFRPYISSENLTVRQSAPCMRIINGNNIRYPECVAHADNLLPVSFLCTHIILKTNNNPLLLSQRYLFLQYNAIKYLIKRSLPLCMVAYP